MDLGGGGGDTNILSITVIIKDQDFLLLRDPQLSLLPSMLGADEASCHIGEAHMARNQVQPSANRGWN